MLQDGDDFSFSFDAANGVGLNFITADTMEDGDITLSFGGESASLVAADLQQTLSDGSKVYFLGVSDVANTFASATVTTNGGGMFLYNVDDIVLARSTPEPTGFLLFGIGIGLTSCSRRRR